VKSTKKTQDAPAGRKLPGRKKARLRKTSGTNQERGPEGRRPPKGALFEKTGGGKRGGKRHHLPRKTQSKLCGGNLAGPPRCGGGQELGPGGVSKGSSDKPTAGGSFLPRYMGDWGKGRPPGGDAVFFKRRARKDRGKRTSPRSSLPPATSKGQTGLGEGQRENLAW